MLSKCTHNCKRFKVDWEQILNHWSQILVIVENSTRPIYFIFSNLFQCFYIFRIYSVFWRNLLFSFFITDNFVLTALFLELYVPRISFLFLFVSRLFVRLLALLYYYDFLRWLALQKGEKEYPLYFFAILYSLSLRSPAHWYTR